MKVWEEGHSYGYNSGINNLTRLDFKVIHDSSDICNI